MRHPGLRPAALIGGNARSTPLYDAAPLPPWTRLVQRLFKHPRLMHYNRLILLVMALNAVVLWYGVSRHWRKTTTGLTSLRSH